MTKISALSDIGTSVASNDTFVLVDVSDPTTPNKKIQQQNLFLIPDGSAGIPGLRFLNDTNTGIYRVGSDSLAISTNGTGRLFVDASGNVGVGASPNATFHITRSAADAVARIDGGSSNTSFIDFRIAGSNKSYVGLGGLTGGSNNDLINYNSSAGNWIAYINGSERMRLDSSGRLGLGTSNPEQQMVVRGSQPFLEIRDNRQGTWNQNDVFSGILFGTDDTSASTDPHAFIKTVHTRAGTGHTSSDAGLTFGTSANTTSPATERVRITQDGLVGIGTTSPSRGPLHLHQAGATNTYLKLTNGTTGETAGDGTEIIVNTSGGLLINNRESTEIAFATAATERARIDSSGRLLVGTSTASVASTLVLQGNSSAFSTQAILVLARGVNNPSDAQLLGSLNFSDSGHAQCGAVEARRDGGTWTSGTSHPTRLVFSTTADGTSSPTERMRITSDAYVRLASGTGGIQFNGDTAAANALDDYEEGTWTPSLVFLTSGSVTLTDVNGYYTKIGRQVFVHCIIRVSTLSSPTGDAVIEGLPFAANSAGSFPQYISVGNTTNAHDIVGNINPDSVLTANQATTINLFKDVQQATRLTGADIVGGGSATAIRISMSYTT